MPSWPLMRVTRLALARFQDCSKNYSLNSVICFYGCKKGCYCYYAIQSSNHQKFIKEKTLSKCDGMIFIKHLCILNRGWLAQLGKRPPTNPVIRVRFSMKEVRQDLFLRSWQYNVQPQLFKNTSSFAANTKHTIYWTKNRGLYTISIE